ncbi:hypothetical protein niasHT_025837 [Heterodera trifolii]|uniref:Uncharacterized protein n=1 Tax=Heterodera trifolii TaxID=157864 RepID=A0ABD2KJ43_9BILA
MGGGGSKETLLIQQHGRAAQQQRVEKGDGGMEEAVMNASANFPRVNFWAINDESQKQQQQHVHNKGTAILL